jgi:hypothetical protein
MKPENLIGAWVKNKRGQLAQAIGVWETEDGSVSVFFRLDKPPKFHSVMPRQSFLQVMLSDTEGWEWFETEELARTAQ